MTIRRALPVLTFTTIVLVLLIYVPSGASDENRAAVVVDFGNGRIAARCISFVEESISGHEALMRTGLPVEVDLQTGGAAVCSIDGQGCPPNDCFCSCRGGGECIYWSYWHLNNGAWIYSAVGSGLYQLRDGGIDGWVWGPGAVTQAIAPPLIPFGEICVDSPTDTPTSTMTPSQTPTQVILPTTVPTEINPATSLPVSSPTTVVTDPATPQSNAISPTPVTAGTPDSQPLSTVSPMTPFVEATLPGTQSAPSATAASTIEPGFGQADETQPLGLPTETQASAGYPESVAVEQTDGRTLVETENNDADAGAPAIGELLVDAPVIDENTATPVVVAAVIGADMDVTTANANTFSPVRSEQSDEGWRPYAGYVGLLLFLVALALLVYRRRSGLIGRDERL